MSSNDNVSYLHIVPRAPAGDVASTVRRVYTVTAGVASTAAQDTAISGNTPERVTFNASNKCFIRFGTATVGAATANDMPLDADREYTFLIYPGEDRYFRAIRDASDAVIRWYRSS